MKNIFKEYIRSFPDFPKAGVIYWDFTRLLQDPDAFDSAMSRMSEASSGAAPTKIAAIEAKGFLIGSALALKMNLPLALIRKQGLSPGLQHTRRFIKEYGHGIYELSKDAIQPGERVLVVYDILAAPGASLAALALINDSGAAAAGFSFVLELEYLNGRAGLGEYPVYSLIQINPEDISEFRTTDRGTG